MLYNQHIHNFYTYLLHVLTGGDCRERSFKKKNIAIVMIASRADTAVTIVRQFMLTQR